MNRITNNMIHNEMVTTLNRQKTAMQKAQSDLSTGVKIRKPSDDPAGAVNQMLFRSRLTELNQYERNVNEAYDRLNIADGRLETATDIMQRVRYLTVQAANGINTDFELSEAIGREIDQHLMALIEIANAKDATGKTLFGGSVIERDAFTPVFSNMEVDGIDHGRSMTGVVYQGDNLVQIREIERHEQTEVSLAGNKVFWGTNMTIGGARDASGYVAQGDQAFAIDGFKIQVSAGDTLSDIVRKVNNAPVEVTATIGAGNDIILSSQTPHQIWLEDLEGSTTLSDLGLIDPNNRNPGNNYHAGATVSGLSVFDVLIQLRNDLVRGDTRSIGGRDLEAIDMAMENILRYRSELGARVNRVEFHQQRIAWDMSYTQDLLAKNEGTDIVETVVDLKWLESVHGYALRVGADLIKPTLMDFLR